MGGQADRDRLRLRVQPARRRQWLTGKEVAEGAADGTVAKYYELQRDNFVKAGAVEKDPVPDVTEYVLFDVMTEAGK